jgi:cytoskeletal protein CcmA (bactofilin family)
MIWTGAARPLDPKRVVPADLSRWSYSPTGDQVAVDPVLGRLMFAQGQTRRESVEVSYSYGFSADMGGGEYERAIREPAGAVVYRVGSGQAMTRIADALAQWKADAPVSAAIEIVDSGLYTEPLEIVLAKGQTLQLRAANRARPVLQLLHWHTTPTNSLVVRGEADSWFILDGIVLFGRGMEVSGDVTGVAIRHSTLIPGWGVDCDCNPQRPSEPSIDLIDAPRCLTIENSITGAIQIERNQRLDDPLQLRISDSIVDATADGRVAIGDVNQRCADARLVLLRSTVIGQIQTREIALAENSIITGVSEVCRRQNGCIRFSYVPLSSRMPRRYECQPDMARQALLDKLHDGDVDPQTQAALLDTETLRVTPQFNAVRYGNPTYCQLADSCAAEIGAGAEDDSEMGAFHNLYQPQRAANLRARMSEYTPAGTDAGIIFVS